MLTIANIRPPHQFFTFPGSLGIIAPSSAKTPIRRIDDSSILDAEILEEAAPEPKWKLETVFPTDSLTAAHIAPQLLIGKEIFSDSIQAPYGFISQTFESDGLSDLYIFNDFWDVSNHLRGRLDLHQLLRETYYKLLEYFSADSQFVLEISRDIYEPSEEQLFLRIVNRSSTSRNLDSLEKFEENWWFERTGFFVGSPVITVG